MYHKRTLSWKYWAYGFKDSSAFFVWIKKSTETDYSFVIVFITICMYV